MSEEEVKAPSDSIDREEDEGNSFVPESKALLKALLFASPEYIPMATLREILGGPDANQIRVLLKEIQKELFAAGEPFEIQEINRTYLMRTKSEYYPWIRKLYREAGARKLSQAALEILALVAYKQPITKAEIEEIRGVNVDGPLRGLLERKLIQITGKSDKIGSAFTYGTTKEFCQYFGISRVPEDLPKLAEFENLIAASNLIPQMGGEGDVVELSVDNMGEDENASNAEDVQTMLSEPLDLFNDNKPSDVSKEMTAQIDVNLDLDETKKPSDLMEDSAKETGGISNSDSHIDEDTFNENQGDSNSSKS